MARTTVVVTAVGEDRPGIVAALAKAMYELGANLDDASMTRLHDIFTTMVSAVLPEGTTVDDCRRALEAASESTGVVVTVQTVNPNPTHGAPPDHLITVYGADRPGIVYGVASHLASRGINITDMDTRRTGSDDAPVYVMLLEVHAGDVDVDAELDDLRTSLDVNVTVQSLDSEAL